MKAMLLAAGFALLATAAQAGDAAHGRQIFQEQCGVCHKGAPGDGEGGQGPNLNGVVGRAAGTAAGFHYTPALKNSGLTWTPQALDQFLSDPSKLVNGTAMPVSLSDPKDRQDIVAYLLTLKAH